MTVLDHYRLITDCSIILKNSATQESTAMRFKVLRFVLICFLVLKLNGVSFAALYPEITRFVEQRTGEFDSIPGERKLPLSRVADYVSSCIASGKTARLTFVCTHNSRRSHLAQVWSQIAAAHYGVRSVETFSGGTKATALNPRTIAVLQRSGLKIEVAEPSDTNPRYAITFQDDGKPLLGFSKVYDAAPNPTTEFCAVMTCSEADSACPILPGSDLRVSLPFEDPKTADDTPLEARTYDERCAQIAREMLYTMSMVRR